MAVATAAGLALVSPGAQAGMREGAVEIGGYLVFAGFDDESNIEDDEGLGGRLGVLFADQHGMEFSFDFISTEGDPDPGLDVDLATFKAGYVLNFAPRAAVSPLFTAGGGFQNVQVTELTVLGEEEVLDATDPLAYAGFGVRFFIGQVFNLRLDGQIQAVFPDGDPDDTLVDGLFLLGFGWVVGGR